MKKIMKKMAALGLAAVMVLGGCAEKTEEEPIIVEPEEEVVEIVEPEEITETEEVLPLSVNVTTNYKNYYVDDSEESYLYLQYCDVEVNGDEYANLKRSVENWSMERSEGLRGLYVNFEESAVAAQEENEEFLGYSLYQNVTTARADGRILSLRDDTYQYVGGAHGMFYREGINFDSKTGKRLTLRDLVLDWDNFAQEASACVIYNLKENYGEELFPDYIETIEAMWQDENQEPAWYLDGSSLVIVLQEYLVGPYAIGAPEIHLSYVEFSQYLNNAYLPGTDSGVAIFQENQELYLNLPGIYEEVPMMLQYEWTDTGANCSLWLGENEKSMDYFDVLKDAYIVYVGEEIYCLIEVDMASNDYVTYVYRLTDGVIEEVTALNAAIDQGNVNAEAIQMEFRVYLLGTYRAMKTYEFDENGRFVTEDTEYVLSGNEYALTTVVDLPVLMDEEETENILPAGSSMILTATDDETYVKFKLQETGQTGVLKVERNEEEPYLITVNGMEERECFEMLPYAG